MGKKMLDLDEAAKVLSVSKEALRRRAQRGSIEAKKDKAGRWQVAVDESKLHKGQDTDQDTSGRQALIEQLRSENEFLKKQLYEQNVILLNLTENIKLLEAPKQRLSLWQRLFGGQQ